MGRVVRVPVRPVGPTTNETGNVERRKRQTPSGRTRRVNGGSEKRARCSILFQCVSSRLVGRATITSSDERGTAYTLIVNDVPVFVRGANWIPDDPFPSRITRERLAATEALEPASGPRSPDGDLHPGLRLAEALGRQAHQRRDRARAVQGEPAAERFLLESAERVLAFRARVGSERLVGGALPAAAGERESEQQETGDGERAHRKDCRSARSLDVVTVWCRSGERP